MKKISIIIVTYNSEKHIYDCLESIFKFNDIGDALEIIIVDNNSKGVVEMFQSLKKIYLSKVKLIENTQNGGYGQGNNVGIQIANGEIIMIMNPDVRLVQPIFQDAVNHFRSKKVSMLGMTQMINPTVKGISYMSKITTGPILGTIETYIFNKLSVYLPSRMYFSGACFFIRKLNFENLGLFDENVFMYGEENDLYFRLRKQKRANNIVYDKHMKYIHLTENRPLSKTVYLQMLNASFTFYSKNGMNDDFYKIREVKREIRRAKFLLFIENKRRNLERVKFYYDWIESLQNLNIK